MKIYVITEYGVCDEHYNYTSVYKSEAEALEMWQAKRDDMWAYAEKNGLDFVEYNGQIMEMEYYDPEDTLGNFNKVIFDTFEV